MGDFPETNPQVVTSTLTLALAGTEATELVILKTKMLGNIFLPIKLFFNKINCRLAHFLI